MINNYSSILLQRTVSELKRLPGIGEKTALRLALHMLKQPKEVANSLSDAIKTMCEELKYCKICHNISDSEICNICNNAKRDGSIICIVEDIRDMMAIENTSQFNGLYHILGGIISPINGVNPSDLNIESLHNRISANSASELILALPATVDGDITNHYLYKNFKQYNLKISIIARGIPIGDELDYTDEITLGRSILMRQDYNAAG